jgi:hypothetical protein
VTVRLFSKHTHIGRRVAGLVVDACVITETTGAQIQPIRVLQPDYEGVATDQIHLG